MYTQTAEAVQRNDRGPPQPDIASPLYMHTRTHACQLQPVCSTESRPMSKPLSNYIFSFQLAEAPTEKLSHSQPLVARCDSNVALLLCQPTCVASDE
jgi:hypothetical protein